MPLDGSQNNMAANRRQSESEGDEDYWQTSSASKKLAKTNFFDDNVGDLQAAKLILKNQELGGIDDTDDIINWDGSAATPTKVEFKSARYRPPPSATSPGTTAPPGSVRRSSAEMLASRPPGGSKIPASSSYNSGLDSNLTIEDAVNTARGKKAPSLSEISKIEAENNYLRRALDDAKSGKRGALSVEDTVKRIIMGQPYSLEAYRAKEDKIALLDTAIKSHDGNAITAAALFLKNTVKPSIFNQEISQRPEAANHYISYLRQHYDFQELVDLLSMLGRTEEAAMFKLQQAVTGSSAQTKIRNLQNCYRNWFQSDPALKDDASLIWEYIALLERQMPIDIEDQKQASAGAPKFQEMPRAGSIVDHPVITTLYYSCLYHYDAKENLLSSPHGIKKEHKLTDKQFMWIALNARARLKDWKAIEELFQTKGWFGGTKMRAPIGFDKVVMVLFKQNAPMDVLNKYCKLIEHSDVRLDTASKFKCHDTAIETLVHMKDRQQLEKYFRSLRQNSQEWYLAKNALATSTVKWKN